MKQPKVKSWFWTVQLGSWLIVGLGNYTLQSTTRDLPKTLLWMNLAALSLGGLLVTSAYRIYLKKNGISFNLTAGKFIRVLILSTLLISVCWLALIMLMFLPVVNQYHLNLLELALNLVPLAFLILAWVLSYMIYHLLSEYHQTEVKRWMLEAEVQKANLGALKAQINPHFMFNSLNNIRALILEDHQKARLMLTRFSELLRYSLQHSEEKETTVDEELDILRQYLELVKLQYEKKLQYQISADEEVLSVKIPPMILQLLAENAVKHGIALLPGGGEIFVSAKKVQGGICLTVKNTGSLQHKNELEGSLGIGLKNISNRLKLLYGDHANLEMKEEKPFVTVSINLKKT